MAEELLTCPACKSTLRLAQEVPEGRKVKCPKCGIQFSPGEELVDEGVVAESPEPRRSRPRDDDYDDRPRRRRRDDDYDDYDDRPRRRSREKPRSLVGTIIILALVILGPLALLGGLYGAYRMMSKSDKGFEAKNPLPPPQPVNNDQNQGNQGKKDQGKKAPTGEAGIMEGDTALEISGEDIDGKKFKLSDYRGKVVLLDFWGHW